ncbi:MULTISPECIES: nitroreductase family protein [unclassified Gordonia (in: high G+C Gram-positive bacteria)]|uniref:nitroreductase family protein n=1 Tax=unclassified Gordonia (in: high G+C Gram-positive bacteria) TaxID=2657482 RepID=UPI0009AC70D3|nr:MULTISPECIES: nitroreductase family protein [unclassified Gordonia (in: high G+C Gram-positive bacteria)]MDF3281595.1 nitroreductase family protein [Gordonia sp. N1V]OPX17302.1 oxidoreductase [Gordonia sp. i37]
MELSEAMRSTGTCRYFSDKYVEDDVLYQALDHARFGPQGGNRQPVRWVIVRDDAVKQRLAELYLPYWEAYYAAVIEGSKAVGAVPATVESANYFAHHLGEVPVLVVVCAEVEGLHPTDNELDRLSVVGGASIYPTVQNLTLALREQGIASALTTLLCAEEPAVKELLHIPDGFLTAAHVAVGYPRDGFPRKLTRTPVEEIAFLDRFDAPMFT